MYHRVQLSRSANCAVVIQGFDLASSVELWPSDVDFMGVEENPQRLSGRVAVDFASFDDVRTGSGPGSTTSWIEQVLSVYLLRPASGASDEGGTGGACTTHLF